MSALADNRNQAVDLLEDAGLKAVAFVPDRLASTPVVIVGPDTSYIEPPEQGTPFGYWVVNLQVLIIAGKGTNKTVTDSMDSLIEKTVEALADEWDITGVAGPGQITVGVDTFLGAPLFIRRSVKF